MTPRNEERADRAEAAVDAWRKHTGNCSPDEADARDLIADLLHLIERNEEPDMPPEQQHQSAWNRYEEERDGLAMGDGDDEADA